MSTGTQSISREACRPNISTAERRKRLAFGVIAFVAALLILGVFMVLGLSRWWRLILLPVFMGAATGFFQWNDKTCVALAALDSRKLGDHMEKIEDAAELAQVKAQARRVQLKSLAAALLLTAVSLTLPIFL